MSTYASSSSTSPLPTSSGKAVPQNDARFNIVGVVLGVIGVLLVAGVIYATLRMKRRRSTTNADDMEQSFVSSPVATSLDRLHPAARITPFGSAGGETPRFKHTPGSDMRIAVRRPDGAWHFADPLAPFTALSVSDVLSSPRASISLGFPGVRAKEHEAKASRDLHYGYDYDIDVNPPPPAYGYDSSGYLQHTKR